MPKMRTQHMRWHGLSQSATDHDTETLSPHLHVASWQHTLSTHADHIHKGDPPSLGRFYSASSTPAAAHNEHASPRHSKLHPECPLAGRVTSRGQHPCPLAYSASLSRSLL